jgi:pimeloyl-ACP methyl ester carboxylesterase
MPRFTTDDGCRIAYDLHDFTDPWKPAATLLLVHGLNSNRHIWYRWVPLLATRFRVLRFDARGRGESSVPPKGFRWSLERYARDILQLLDAAGVKRVHYVGTSMGGFIGQYFAARYPKRLHTLVLASAPYRFPEGMTAWAEKIEAVGSYAFFKEDGQRLFNPEKVDPGLIEWNARQMAATPQGVATAQLRFVAGLDLSKYLPKITTPALILAAGASDRAPLADTQAMHAMIKGSELVVFEGANHSIVQMDPERCVRAILDFYDRIASRTA